MTIMKPNRTRAQSNGYDEVLRKASGDQHVIPTDDPESDPHRPHRMNRRDIQKAVPFSRGSSDVISE